MSNDEIVLAALVNAGKFDEAEAFCLDKLKTASENNFWLTQLGYVYFLNEEDCSAFYEKCVDTFAEIVEKDKSDQNALFWLAYISHIVIFQHDVEISQAYLRQVLRSNPEHPYANLIMAGFSETSDEEKIGYLTATLRLQPANLRAAHEYIEILLKQEKFDEARQFLAELEGKQPCIEANYGIMNEYINGVFIGASSAVKYFKAMKDLVPGSPTNHNN